MSPPNLPPRYQIRPLSLIHTPWANALTMHATLFSSPVWSNLEAFSNSNPTTKTQKCYALYKAATRLISHQITSGLSLGVFDTQYQFTYPDSAEISGKLHWDLDDETASGETLRKQMDFPLVSVALAYDSFTPFDEQTVKPVMEVFPQLAVRNRVLNERDRRDAKEWQAKGPGEVMFRNGTATKVGEEGKGFMKALAWEMMERAARGGWRGVQIVCLHDAVSHVWTHPPEPFRGEVVARCNCAGDEDGELREAFRGSGQEMTKVYVTLRS
ncbi:hypothetical protein B0T16DRAFT_324238 [Cercophora newfieldiana]|uniref:Uncharacterized protein n=1 Tax=Cercophora newfieldiana TaxID=92897 RepID=A0AA39YDR2_9PEZI|nr:hypothetical protein B0T16DRAFT_324238 [Cercophora newfieldiana]